jgi:hypothetical protein
MAINLKQILISDTDNIKLDKVNYNFDQLVANGGGPQGSQGTDGTTGYQGITGYQGNQGIPGPQGYQGSQGSNGQGIWKINQGNAGGNVDTILPIHNDLASGPQGTEDAPSIVVGYKTEDPEYSALESNSQFVINRHDPFQNNLELKSFDVDSSFTFDLKDNGNQMLAGSILTMQFRGLGAESGTLNNIADKFIWRKTEGSPELVSIDENSFTTTLDAEFNNLTVYNGLTIDDTSADVDKIAVSSNADGLITFKSIDEIGGVVPVGTIVSMVPSYFTDSTKFINQETLNSVSSHPLQIKVGAGINEHAGWYLCNGQDWTNGESTYSTPDLNSFSYTIDNDPNITDSTSQGDANVSNNSLSIIGGADASLTGIYNSGSSDYTVTGTIDPNITENFYTTTGSTYVVKKLPQIIYLGLDDLYWSDAGSNQGYVPGTFTIADWTGSVSLTVPSSGGHPAFTLGNSTDVRPQTNQQPFPANSTQTDNGPYSYNYEVLVPSGYANSGSYIQDTIQGVIVETSYNPTYTATLNFQPGPNALSSLLSYSDTFGGTQGSQGAGSGITVDAPADYYFVDDPSISYVSGPQVNASISHDGDVFASDGTTSIGKTYTTSFTIGSGPTTTTYEYSGKVPQILTQDVIETAVATSLGSGGINWEWAFSSIVITNAQGNHMYTGRPNATYNLPISCWYVGPSSAPVGMQQFSIQTSQLSGLNLGYDVDSDPSSPGPDIYMSDTGNNTVPPSGGTSARLYAGTLTITSTGIGSGEFLNRMQHI